MPSPLLIVSATAEECVPILKILKDCENISPFLFAGNLQGRPVEILIGGIGAIATTFRLTQTMMQRSYSRAISIGIAGSYEDDIPIGDVVQITEDCFAELGIDDNGTFLTLREAGLAGDDDFPFADNFIANPSPTLSPHCNVRGITVQTASGSRERIATLTGKYQPQVETMENAAFFYTCRMMQIPFASFRAISNKMEPRNRQNWRIAEAIERVNSVVIDIVTGYN